MNNSLEVPKQWKKMKEKDYKKLGVYNNEVIKCLGSYVTHMDKKPIIINFYDYSKYNVEFLEKLDKYYEGVNEMNELIDGNPDDEDYESTATLSSLYHGYISDVNGLYYMAINKVLSEQGYSYVIQMFAKSAKKILCCEMNTYKIDEKNVLNSVKEATNVKDALSHLIELLNIE